MCITVWLSFHQVLLQCGSQGTLCPPLKFQRRLQLLQQCHLHGLLYECYGNETWLNRATTCICSTQSACALLTILSRNMQCGSSCNDNDCFLLSSMSQLQRWTFVTHASGLNWTEACQSLNLSSRSAAAMLGTTCHLKEPRPYRIYHDWSGTWQLSLGYSEGKSFDELNGACISVLDGDWATAKLKDFNPQSSCVLFTAETPWWRLTWWECL